MTIDDNELYTFDSFGRKRRAEQRVCGNMFCTKSFITIKGSKQRFCCMRCGQAKQETEVGKSYGYLEIREECLFGIDRYKYVIAKCVCQAVFSCRLGNIKSGNTTSCGCKKAESAMKRARPYSEAAAWQCYRRYMASAKKRHIQFELSFEEFIEMAKSNCYYCKSAPQQVLSLKYTKGKNIGKERLNGSFVYNGIDRVDNSLGYLKSNSAACCVICNRAKLDKTSKEWSSWLLQVASNKEQIQLMLSRIRDTASKEEYTRDLRK